jgi:hypothetical protein
MSQTLFELVKNISAEAWELLTAFVLNLLFLALSALLLWPLHMTAMTFRLAKGYVILWVVVFIAHLTVNFIQKLFRVDMYTHADAYLISNLIISCFLVAGWSAFAALTVRGFGADASNRVTFVLYLFGVLSSLIACLIVGSFYRGSIYKLVNLPLAFACLLLFALWPATGRMIYGWFFNLFLR